MLLWALGIVSAIGAVGTIAAVIAVPGIAIPILQAVTKAILKCKPCMAVLAAIALLFAGALYGVHVERERAETRIERMRQAAAEQAKQRDRDVKADLEQRFRPWISQIDQLQTALRKEATKHVVPKPAARPAGAVVGKCPITPDALRLRVLRAREPAAGLEGRPVDHLRRYLEGYRASRRRAR